MISGSSRKVAGQKGCDTVFSVAGQQIRGKDQAGGSSKGKGIAE
ncbi:unnamed protein product [Linum tenue]|uniref:Uncharacterized protein n=1 Tax=Linum tenue TaxID=586396 RepID=A0AAV0LBM3_9ROSI|nr:unnamed protein product [Linum tenue]